MTTARLENEKIEQAQTELMENSEVYGRKSWK
ncbi:hypothetical protein BCL90_3187 [Pedobacter alluvionis]|uniref:Uncharacterized protein n=1 Tax=Pedobacter alluvionis TaxID=475253 RepID=A0A497Y072_9SPHI|nr:hypothetical protein BCL90_3187 [Pedobacter alluvionis]